MDGVVPDARVEARRGLRVVDDADATSPPAAFVDCADGATERRELVDEDGEHVFLAVDARLDDDALVPAGLLDGVDGAALFYAARTSSWDPAATLSLVDDDGVIVALGANAPIDHVGGGLAVEGGGADALAVDTGCGPVSTYALRFLDDDGEHAARNGETLPLVAAGRPVAASNIFTIERGRTSTTSCDDAPAPGVRSTWVAVGGAP